MYEMKFFPPESPQYYWNLASEVYASKNQPLTQELHKKVNEWQVYLFRRRQTNELIVCFRGTKNSDNWKGAIKICEEDSKHIIQTMEKVIEQWQQKTEETITTFVGHSAGGYFATNVHKDWKVLRITWNAFRATSGPLTVNFRTKNDPLSAYERRLENYVTVCEGGHSIYDFEKELKHLTWEKILSAPGNHSFAHSLSSIPNCLQIKPLTFKNFSRSFTSPFLIQVCRQFLRTIGCLVVPFYRILQMLRA